MVTDTPKKRLLHRIAGCVTFLICSILPIGVLHAQTPEMEEQLVYRLRLYNGKDYQDSFCPKTVDAIYILANAPSVLNPRMTMVYYWPITRRYMPGFKSLNEPVAGTLEILQGGRTVQELQSRTYTFFRAKGWYAGKSEIILDKKADERYEEYLRAMKEFNEKLKTYHEKKQLYLEKMNEFYARARKRQELGVNSKQPPRITIPQEPPFPQSPEFYTQEPESAFILNLPPGRYKIRLKASDGTIIEESEKRLVIFTHRRTGRIGYEVVSAERWTMPETSSESDEVIYLVGENTLYLRPYIQTEYNHLHYAKVLDPQNDGYPELWRWINIKQIEKGRLKFYIGGRLISSIGEKPYQVQQIPGPELGYKIIDYDKDKFPDRAPSLVGYKLDLHLEGEGYRLQLVDSAGTIIHGSERVLREVEARDTWKLFLVSIVLPLVAYIPIFIWRRRKLL